jgi:hypothetical protein
MPLSEPDNNLEQCQICYRNWHTTPLNHSAAPRPSLGVNGNQLASTSGSRQHNLALQMVPFQVQPPRANKGASTLVLLYLKNRQV